MHKNQSFSRTDRLSSLIARELATIIQKHFESNHDIGMIAINEVKVSSDLSYADVYFSFVLPSDNDNHRLKSLQKRAPEIRSLLSPSIKARKVPALRFHIDESINYARHMSDVLDKIKGDI